MLALTCCAGRLPFYPVWGVTFPRRFRLQLLIPIFGFVAVSVILNKATSPIVVITALPAPVIAVSPAELASHWPIVVNLLAGSLIDAWVGAAWATRMRSATRSSPSCWY